MSSQVKKPDIRSDTAKIALARLTKIGLGPVRCISQPVAIRTESCFRAVGYRQLDRYPPVSVDSEQLHCKEIERQAIGVKEQFVALRPLAQVNIKGKISNACRRSAGNRQGIEIGIAVEISTKG